MTDPGAAERAQKRLAIAVHSSQAAEFAAAYARLAEDPYSDCFGYSRKRLAELLNRLLPASGEGLRLLDVGCGTGHQLSALQATGFAVSGTDGSEEMLEQARRLNPGLELKRGDVESLPFEDARFDFVTCIEVLRYLPKSERCLQELRRVLKPGGICLATATPLFNANGYWLVNRIATLLSLRGFVALRQYFVTSFALRAACSRAGFADVRIHGVYLGPVNWVERLLPAALPRLLRWWERYDRRLADSPLLREFANMFLVRGVAASSGAPQ